MRGNTKQSVLSVKHFIVGQSPKSVLGLWTFDFDEYTTIQWAQTKMVHNICAYNHDF